MQLAKRKVKAWALDANEQMLAYAADKAAAAGTSLTIVQGDMMAFDIQVSEAAMCCMRACCAAARIPCL